MKIAFTAPNHTDLEKTPAWLSYVKVNEVYPQFVISRGSFIAHVRNAAVTEKNNDNRKWRTDFNFDKILFIDSDISFSLGDIQRLDAYDLPIVSGAYLVKRQPDKLACGQWIRLAGNCINSNPGETGLKKVDWCGSGFVMVKKEVFMTMPYPWYRSYVIETAEQASETSEDVGFCILAQQYGYTVMVDYNTVLMHHTLS